MAVEVYKPNAAAVQAAASAALAKIKGRQKAAVLLVSIGTERAARVFERLRDEEIETLSLEMAKSAAVVTWENLSEEMRLATRLGIEAAVQTYMTEMLAK